MADVLPDIEWLTGRGYDVVMGTRKANGAVGVYVALEHPNLPVPKEFCALTLADAIRQAAFWAGSAQAPPRTRKAPPGAWPGGG
jgi:hypothetical protein